jgi:phenylpropionate dioxygenase-like ring-hydroxylating dioxygenase large terminal subunit
MMRDGSLDPYWFPVCASGELGNHKPIGSTLLEEDIVVWRAGKQTLAWSDFCAHRGARLSCGRVKSKRLQCPYHGWEYNANGICELIPAEREGRIPERARAKAVFQACEYAGLIWVKLSDKPTPLPELPSFADPDYGLVTAGPFHIKTSAARMCENFLDVAHFPFVHDGILGDASHPEAPEIKVQMTKTGLRAENVVIRMPGKPGAKEAGKARLNYGVLLPTSVYIIAEFLQESSWGGNAALMLAVRPVSPTESCAYILLAVHGVHDKAELDRNIQLDIDVLMQDIPVVESQEPKLLPLDLRSEIQLKSDALTAAYRVYLRKLGITYGTQ